MLFKQIQQLPFPLTSLTPVFIIFTQICCIFLLEVPAQAEIRYVKPSTEVVVRRGQGTDYKVIAMVKDGTSVEFLEEGDDFTKVLLKNGKKGWILKRFLSVEPPLNELVDSLRTQREEMLQREAKNNQQLEAFTMALGRTEQERDNAQNQTSLLQASYKKLKQDTADVVQIKTNMQKISQENTVLVQKLALLEQANETLRKDYSFKWFLAGGGVLIFGMIIGGLFRGRRKKKPSLL